MVHGPSLGNTDVAPGTNLVMTKIAQVVDLIRNIMICTDGIRRITRIYTTPFVLD